MKLLKLTSILAVLALASGLASCKTSEKNYRAAYEKAMAADRDSTRTSFDQTIYGQNRRQMRTMEIAAGNDTLSVRSIYVQITPEEGVTREWLKRYCVVAAEFKQLFNAKSVRSRLRSGGYPGAFIVNTREPYYYVVAGSYAMHTQALETLQKLQTAPPFPLRQPAPFILVPEQLR